MPRPQDVEQDEGRGLRLREAVDVAGVGGLDPPLERPEVYTGAAPKLTPVSSTNALPTLPEPVTTASGPMPTM